MNKRKDKFSVTDSDIDDMIDDMIFKCAEKSYTDIPKDLDTHIVNTIENLDFSKSSLNKSNCSKVSENSLDTTKYPKYSYAKNIFNYFQNKFRTVAIGLISLVLISTSFVGAKQISEKFFNKENVRLDNIGIANEFIFTSELENSLKQNIPLNLVQLDDNYFINIQSILVDEINFFTVFELHSKEKITDDLRFTINDLEIKDESGTVIYKNEIELRNALNCGYKNIYNTNNSIKELFFMFGSDCSNLSSLTYKFSNIEIYRYNTALNQNASDKNLLFESKKINIALTKENYSTRKEYTLQNDIESIYSIEKAILTNTGLYILTNSKTKKFKLIIGINEKSIKPEYNLPLKRAKNNSFQNLFVFNIADLPENITLYNNIDNTACNLIEKN